MRRCRPGDDTGTTLIELAIATGIFMLLLFATLQMLDSGTRSERAQQARHDALVELRMGIDRVERDLRQATSVDTASTASRLDVQTLIQGASHEVVYDVVDGELRRSVDGASPTPLADRITTPAPFCYDPPDCTGAAPADPTIVRVTLAIEPDAFSGGPITLASDVQLRNSGVS